MKFGDSVLYSENGQTYKATVLGERVLDHHSGANDEPLLHLAFFKDVPGVFGTARQNELVNFRVDVAHESHAFKDEHRLEAKDKGMTYPSVLAGGRWTEIPAPVVVKPAKAKE